MPMDVLLVDDNRTDARLLRELLSEINKDVRLHVVTDGFEAMAFLRRHGPYTDARRPDLILLDLSMPKMDGLEVLVQLKQDPRFKTIPIVVLTISQLEADIEQSYKLMANCYLTKPDDLKEFESLVKSLNDFWLTRVKFHRNEQLAQPS